MASIQLINGTVLKDYTHASNIFRPNGYARSPKMKFLFHVVFNINSAVKLDSNIKRDISFLVQKAELPKYSVETKIMNQYNRKQLNQTKINYQPVSIVFHDDNANEIRELWRTYYNYYYADGRYDSATDVYTRRDRYADRTQNVWGFDPSDSPDFFDSIDIFSFHAGKSFMVKLVNPMIATFNHDTHDYAENSVMEHTMTLNYTTVKYLEGYWAGVEGFADSASYDTVSGPNTNGNNIGQVLDTKTGTLIDPPVTMTDNSVTNLPDLKTQQIGNGTSTNITQTPQIVPSQILDNQSNNKSPYVFPTAGVAPEFYTGAPPATQVPTAAQQVTSENSKIPTSANTGTTYPEGSWQAALQKQGYTDVQIQSVAPAVKTASVSAGAGISFDSSNKLTATTTTKLNVGQQITLAIRLLNKRQPLPLAVAPSNTPVILSGSDIQPIYNPQTWQEVLRTKGYNEADISQADNSMSNIVLSPEVDRVAYAERYIQTLYDNNGISSSAIQQPVNYITRIATAVNTNAVQVADLINKSY